MPYCWVSHASCCCLTLNGFNKVNTVSGFILFTNTWSTRRHANEVKWSSQNISGALQPSINWSRCGFVKKKTKRTGKTNGLQLVQHNQGPCKSWEPHLFLKSVIHILITPKSCFFLISWDYATLFCCEALKMFHGLKNITWLSIMPMGEFHPDTFIDWVSIFGWTVALIERCWNY